MMDCHSRERSEEHTSELQSQFHLVCRLLLAKKKHQPSTTTTGPHARGRRPTRPTAAAGAMVCVAAISHARSCARRRPSAGSRSFFFNDTATTEIYTLSLHDALPIFGSNRFAGTRKIGMSADDAPRALS